jgi:AraC-like DNA-binding protein
VRPTEQVVYRHGEVEVGAFRCPPDHPNFAREGAIRDHCAFVFPRTPVWIRHEGERPFLADPGVVVLYNPAQPYTREALSPAGDRCEWFAVDAETAREVVAEVLPAARERARRPFPFGHAPCDSASYLAQRELFLSLVRGGEADPLRVEEEVLALLARVLRVGLAAGAGGDGRASEREREAVGDARALLAARFEDALGLGTLAGEVGLSRFRLCRAFRRITGTTIHSYRDRLRTRTALEALDRGAADLTGLALDLGYSSHSHFTERFRRAFGVTPSEVRARLAPCPAGRQNTPLAEGRTPPA